GAGLMYAAGDVATKAAAGGGGRLAFVPVLLACHGLAFVFLQLGFQRGSALATAGVATLLTNALPIAAGIALFHERLPGGALGGLRALAFAAVVVGARGRVERVADGNLVADDEHDLLGPLEQSAERPRVARGRLVEGLAAGEAVGARVRRLPGAVVVERAALQLADANVVEQRLLD